MKIPRSVVSSGGFLTNSLLVLVLVSAGASVGSASYQSNTTVRKTEPGVVGKTVRTTDSSVTVRRGFEDIPEATEPCTPEECEWWQRIRKASHNLIKESNEKTKTRFFLLMYEGQQKAYRIPLKDRPHQLLAFAREPTRPEIAQKRHIGGTVELSVEYRADGAVGDVQIVKGLGFGIDENVIEATRQHVFLPAVRNRSFVAEWSNAKIEFWDRWAKKAKGSED